MRPSCHAKIVRWSVAVAAVLALAPAGAFAKPVSKDEAAAAVAGWLKQPVRSFNAPADRTVKSVGAYKDAAGAPLCYVASLAPSGFVVLPADDLVEPVICFSPDGKYDASARNLLGSLVRHDISTRMAATHGPQAAEAQAQQKEMQRKWDRLRAAATAGPASATPSNASDDRVPPLVQSLWSQGGVSTGYCYNYYTPNHDVCGCVATAMAQLMRFHKYPTVACGSAAPDRLRGGNGPGGTYDWANMPLAPAHATETQRKAIGALCFDVGAAVDMQYSAYGSGAEPMAATMALRKVFFYGNAICSADKSIVGSGLNGMINPNLDAGFPVLLGIKITVADGHMILVDGYGYNASTLYHHLNMGWGGADNAWYSLPAFDDGRDNWASSCIYNVYPSGSGEIISGRVTDSAGAPISEVTVQATGIYGNNYKGTAKTDARGIFAFGKVPSAASYTLTARKSGCAFSPQNVTTGTSRNDAGASGNVWDANFVSSAKAGSGR